MRQLLFAALCALLSVGPASAQPFPSKPVTLVVPFPPGGIIDAYSRLLAANLQEKWKQPVVVDNRPGAGGVIGLDYVARQPADGHTIVANGNAASALKLVNKTIPLDPVRDITGVSMVGQSAYVLVTTPEVPAATLKEFIAHVKANPGKLNYAAVGQSSQLMDTIMFLNGAGLDMTFIPYAGSAPIQQALLKNEVQLYFNSYFAAVPQAKEGKMKILAVTGNQRFDLLPDVPTVKESGVPVEAPLWYGIFASAKTPAPLLDRIAADIADVVKLPAVSAKLRESGLVPRTTTPAETQKLILDGEGYFKEAARIGRIEPQ